MPALVLQARFAKDARTVRLEIESSWWPSTVFDREKSDDAEANQQVYEQVRDALLPLGFKEVDV